MLVLLPGLDGTGRLLEPFVARLPAGCETQIIRYPAHTALSYEELTAHVVERMPRGRSVTLIAESFSGPIALRLSQRSDLGLLAVVLVCSFASRPLGRLGWLLAGLPLEWIFRVPTPLWLLRYFLLNRDAPLAAIKHVRAAVESVDPAVLAARLRQALTSGFCEPSIEPRCRVVALYGTRDRLLTRHAVGSIQRVCPRAEIRTIDAPHLALQSTPDQAVRQLVDLL